LEEQVRKEKTESKKKWVAGEFKKTFGRSTNCIKVIPPVITVSSPIGEPHRFRDIHKDKWVVNKNFIT
jgi:hypothetical protein